MSLDELLEVAIVLIAGSVVAGVAIAVGGATFRRAAPPGQGPFREGAAPAPTARTPTRVRVLGVVSVLIGAFTMLVLAPAGALGSVFGLDGLGTTPHGVEAAAWVLLGAGALSGLVLGPAVAIVAVLLTRGRAPRAARIVGMLWIAHHALVCSFFFAMALLRIQMERQLELTSQEWPSWVLGGAVVLGLGAAHGAALIAAAGRMSAIVGETNGDRSPP